MNFLSTPILYGLGAVAVGAGLFAGVQTVRLAHAQSKYDHHLAADADATAKAQRAARAKEQAAGERQAAIEAEYLRDQADAQAKFDRTVADLRRGTVRLREQWRCPAGVSGSAIAAGEPDGQADDRSASAGAIVRAAAQCDAQVIGLQAIVSADRQ